MTVLDGDRVCTECGFIAPFTDFGGVSFETEELPAVKCGGAPGKFVKRTGPVCTICMAKAKLAAAA